MGERAGRRALQHRRRFAGRAINRAYIDAKVTATINWALEWSAYHGLPADPNGLLLANEPWSGHYTIGPSVWSVAQTTQFTQPGWRYIDSGSARIPGGSVVSPARAGLRRLVQRRRDP